VTMRRLNRYNFIEIWWMSGIENFVSVINCNTVKNRVFCGSQSRREIQRTF